MNNNFKLKALVSDGEWFSKGDVLEFKDGKCIYNNGNESSCYSDFEDYINHNKSWQGCFVLLKDEDKDDTYEDFTKQDLKTGMIIELRNGKKAMILLGTKNGDIFGGEIYGSLDNFDYNLKNNTPYNDLSKKYVEQIDIIKVYQPILNYLSNGIFGKNTDNYDLIWERREEPHPREMTVKEIEKELGYSVKIVK